MQRIDCGLMIVDDHPAVTEMPHRYNAVAGVESLAWRNCSVELLPIQAQDTKITSVLGHKVSET